MRTLGNILWHFPFLGFLTAFTAFILGALFIIIVVTAPIGIGLIQYSKFLLLPYSYSMISSSETNIAHNPLWEKYSFIVRILYFPIGLFLAFATAIQAALCFISIIGIPVAIPLAKSIGTYFNPIGKICVDYKVAEKIENNKANKEFETLNS